MPRLPTPSDRRVPIWPASLPWVLLAMVLTLGIWLFIDVRQQLLGNAALVETNASLRRYSANTTLRMAEARGWATAYTLLPEFLPEVVTLLGPGPELREIAVTGLTHRCASVLEHRSEQSPAFSADSRWIITRLADGTLVFSDVNFLDPTSWHLKAGAKDFRIDAHFLYYQTSNGWQRAALRTPPDGQAEIGPAEPFNGVPPEPSKPPTTALILPRIGGTPARLTFQGGRDPEVPVHPLTKTGSSPYSVVLSPDGRFAAVWIEKQAIQIWRLSFVREHLARLGLDWNVREFPPSVNDERVEGTLKGAEAVPPAWRTAPPAKSVQPASTSPRRQVILPTDMLDTTLGDDISIFTPDNKPAPRRSMIQESSAPGSKDKQPRRRIVLPPSE